MEEQIVRLLKLQNKEEFKRVVSLSKQYSQTVSQKKLSGQPIEHPYVCVDLALESGGAESSNNKEVLFKKSGTTKRCYQDTKRSYRNILGLKDNSSDNLKQIVIKYAPNTCNMVARVKSLQSTFQQRFLKTLSEEQRGFVDFSRPVFTIVAFWSMAKLEKVKVAKQELIHEFDLKQTEFDNIKQQMQEICSDILETKNNAASSSKRKNQNSGSTPSGKNVEQSGGIGSENADIGSAKRNSRLSQVL
eukprot:TRINITY_DN8956_c0_g1_i4.p1 TRINITY_DN8956_c0_g1~~TRINITY_DN8956_c0_g1_i4.p1  ORF type:complete len:246 (-),score=35.89 TRINITY_DN8956_c0_g1_i4:599-1336(-)